MRLSWSATALTGMLALCVTACSVQRKVTADTQLRVERAEWKDSTEKERIVVMDTLREITTVTVLTNDKGDTLRVSMVTDRTRARERSRQDMATYRTVLRVDTVYIEKRDSIEIRSRPSGPLNKGSNLVAILKWLFAIVVALIGLKVSPFLWRREKK